jgi:hypothetical protein
MAIPAAWRAARYQAKPLHRDPVAFHHADTGDSPAPDVDKVRRGQCRGRGVVDDHVVELGVQELLTDKHDRDMGVQALDVLFAQRLGIEDDPVDEVRPESTHGHQFTLVDPVRMIDQDDAPLLLPRTDDVTRDAREIRIV